MDETTDLEKDSLAPGYDLIPNIFILKMKQVLALKKPNYSEYTT